MYSFQGNETYDEELSTCKNLFACSDIVGLKVGIRSSGTVTSFQGQSLCWFITNIVKRHQSTCNIYAVMEPVYEVDLVSVLSSHSGHTLDRQPDSPALSTGKEIKEVKEIDFKILKIGKQIGRGRRSDRT